MAGFLACATFLVELMISAQAPRVLMQTLCHCGTCLRRGTCLVRAVIAVVNGAEICIILIIYLHLYGLVRNPVAAANFLRYIVRECSARHMNFRQMLHKRPWSYKRRLSAYGLTSR